MLYLALNTSFRGTTLGVRGLAQLRKYRDSQRDLSSSYYSTLMGKQAHQFEAQFCKGLPAEWEECILRLHNEREVFSRYPHASLSYFFTEDGWTIDTSWSAPQIELGHVEEVKAPTYSEIPLLISCIC